MNLLKKLKAEQELEQETLLRRTLLSDATLQELEQDIQIQATQKIAEREIFTKEIHQDIEIAQQYINIGSWKKALETLKHRSDRHDTPQEERKIIEQMYKKAETLMEEARNVDPHVPLFTHFNLPTDDVN